MFTIAFNFPQIPNTQAILAFMQFLHENSISPMVINNYLISKAVVERLGWPHAPLCHNSISLFIKSISNSASYTPKFKGHFDLPTIRFISQACDILTDPLLYRAIFLTAFYAFLRLSIVAPHSRASFSPTIHPLRKDVLFAPPGAHLLMKWAKNMQGRTQYKFVQIPSMTDELLCPVTALRRLLNCRHLSTSHPLFAHTDVVDTTCRY